MSETRPLLSLSRSLWFACCAGAIVLCGCQSDPPTFKQNSAYKLKMERANMAATPVDIFIHDTYFIVAHFHYVLFSGTAMAVFGAIYFWFPKMFGRMMNETWGKVHFFLTFIFLNGTFYTMHILGAVGFPRRLADPYDYETFRHLQPMLPYFSIPSHDL